MNIFISYIAAFIATTGCSVSILLWTIYHIENGTLYPVPDPEPQEQATEWAVFYTKTEKT